MIDLTGKNLGQYVIQRKLGQGGMGAVYQAYQANMDRDVAIKALPPTLALDPSFITRFRREARTIANLQHARILPVHDYGEEEGTAYLVMRYLDGPPRLPQPIMHVRNKWRSAASGYRMKVSSFTGVV